MNRLKYIAAYLVVAAAASACVTVGFSTRTYGTDIEGLQVEIAYNNVYSTAMAKLHVAMQAFAPSGANPGVCNVGGVKQGCHDADEAAIGAMREVITALEATPVPPRYVQADALFRAALAENIHGLELRNLAIEQNDNEAWKEHQAVLQSAQEAIIAAYQAYPADNRPLPAP